MNIHPALRDLLLRNQKALIPQFGSFVIIQRPAQFNKVTRELKPPNAVIRFDQSLQTDDGQLSGYLIRKLKLTEEAAQQAINEFRQQVDLNLNGTGTFILEGIGELVKQKSGDIKFSPEEELSKRISLFDLPKLNIPVSEAEKIQIPAVNKNSPVVPVRRKRRLWIPAALLAILIGLSSAIYLTGNFGTLITDMKALVTGENKKETEKIVFGKPADATPGPVITDTLKNQISRELDERVNREHALSIDEAGNNKPGPQAISRPNAVQSVPLSTDKPYLIIAGAFLIAENAEKQKAILEKKGFSPAILPKRGKYIMVALGSYNTRELADQAVKELQTKIDNELWVLKK